MILAAGTGYLRLFQILRDESGNDICGHRGDYMAVTMILAAYTGRRLGRRTAQGAVVALASMSLLVAAPDDSFGKARKHEARHSRQAVAHAVSRSVAKWLRTQNLAMPKLVAAVAQDGRDAGAPAPRMPLRSAIVIDAATGAVLSEIRPDMAAYPASLTKMMTLYLTFAALNDGRLRVDQLLPVSSHASGQAPTKLWLKPGDTVPVQTLILGLVTRSANDAAVVLAEALAGSETDFAALMTETAHRLAMSDTTFRNASGLPDPEQHTTARDLARLSLALYQDFPREYAYFSVRAFAFRGQTITTHNHMLDSYEGSDGLKTGFIRASGFNLAASAERHGHRLIGVVLGSPSWPVRDREMAALFDRGFAALGAVQVASADTVEPAPARSKHPGLAARLAAYASPIGKALAAPNRMR
jgi:D-alanyl-D-alanine carboxypeptidase